MAGDWIKLHRKSLETAAFASEQIWKLWSYCLLKANYRDQWVTFEGGVTPILVKRGQFITGRFALQKEMYPKQKKTDPSPSSVWRWLQSLRNMGNVDIETHSKFSIVTVCKYETYQCCDGENGQQLGQQADSKRTASGQQADTNKKDKKVKKGEEGEESPPLARAFGTITVNLPPPFDCQCAKDALESWFTFRAAQGRPEIDPDRAAIELTTCNLFATADELVQSVVIAKQGEYKTLRNYVLEHRRHQGNGQPAEPDYDPLPDVTPRRAKP